MELIRKSDALNAVLHHQGDAAVAAVQNIKPINPHGELREMLIDEIIDKGEWQDEQFNCADMMMRDAADAIERLTAEVERKDRALQAWVKTWESRKENALRHICDHCDTPIDVRLRENACEDCPIKILIKEIFDEQP